MSTLLQIFSKSILDFEWKYYKDGKVWMGSTFKKKTIVWISVWGKFFKASLYFTENSPPLLSLNIDQGIKSSFSSKESIGKLVPLIVGIKKRIITRLYFSAKSQK